ncbi:unnamed protein product [Rotaria sp. Silwood1]|nr:unnamed protein product [Rotaria sp. Silwood1]
MVINVSFMNIVGKTIQTQLPDDFSIENFRNLISSKIDPSAIQHYRFIANNKELCLDNDEDFAKRKHLIKNGVTIFLLRRMHGGGFVESAVLIDIVIDELPNELRKIQTNINEYIICLEEKPCLTLCCGVICLTCFSNYIKQNDLQLNCLICRRTTPYERFFITADFIRTMISHREIRDLTKNIDCQICHCGALLVNETLFAQQTCQHCRRIFCFFCNKDWTDGAESRRNDRYTCHANCDYKNKLNYDLVPYAQNRNTFIPNSRCCPKCFNVGAYDGKCKYHQCAICRPQFCFLCLAPKAECDKDGNSIKIECGQVKRQDYTMFPRIVGS